MARDADKKRQAQHYRASANDIRRLLNQWDVIPGSPSDEYDCLIPKLYALLTSGPAIEEIENWLSDELGSHFGIAPDQERERALAELLQEWAQTQHLDS